MGGTGGYGRPPTPVKRPESANLADILERVLDKGIVIVGDIQVNLLDIELLTIKLRLIVASVDRAKEMGIDWWERDPTLSSRGSEIERENRELRDRVAALEAGVDRGRAPAERRERRVTRARAPAEEDPRD
ncbi:gas vesicle protein [Actinomadura sp. HBU206391]|nr:gas vesicle protein [Actinomadura sp. HBU206391]MBC6457357.1 gas vesicle protein [Actinomadura sp. HBU206391]